jgi:hypothetical protein
MAATSHFRIRPFICAFGVTFIWDTRNVEMQVMGCCQKAEFRFPGVYGQWLRPRVIVVTKDSRTVDNVNTGMSGNPIALDDWKWMPITRLVRV